MGTIAPREYVLKSGERACIRSAVPDDALALLAISTSVAAEGQFTVSEPDEFQLSEEWERAWIEEHSDGPGKLLLVAEVAGDVVGILNFRNEGRRRVSHRGTMGISVRADWRERGVGTALLRSLLEWARESPLIEKVCLSVFATNQRAIALYRKLGFVEEGRRPRGIQVAPGKYVDEVLMAVFVTTPAAGEEL